MDHWLQLVVRFLHVFSGVLWVGGAVAMSLVVGRTLMGAGPAVAGPAMGRIGPVSFRYFSYVGTAAILFGVWNQYLMAGGLDYRSTQWNVLLGASLVIAVTMMGIGGGVIGATLRRMQALAPKGPPAGGAPPAPHPEMAKLQKRMMVAGLTNVVLGVVAVFLMVWATTLGVGAG